MYTKLTFRYLFFWAANRNCILSPILIPALFLLTHTLFVCIIYVRHPNQHEFIIGKRREEKNKPLFRYYNIIQLLKNHNISGGNGIVSTLKDQIFWYRIHESDRINNICWYYCINNKDIKNVVNNVILLSESDFSLIQISIDVV